MLEFALLGRVELALLIVTVFVAVLIASTILVVVIIVTEARFFVLTDSAYCVVSIRLVVVLGWREVLVVAAEHRVALVFRR